MPGTREQPVKFSKIRKFMNSSRIPRDMIPKGILLGATLLFAPMHQAVSAQDFFMTHHSPMGAWSSLTFGLPGEGVGIDAEGLRIQPLGDLVVGVSRGPGRTTLFPFLSAPKTQDSEAKAAGAAVGGEFRSCHVIPAEKLTRKLTPGTDEFSAEGMRLRVTSPRGVLTGSLKSGGNPIAVLPAVLVDLEIDNSDSDVAATCFLGFVSKGYGRLRPLDWGNSELAGVAYQDRWALASMTNSGAYTVRGWSLVDQLENGSRILHGGGNEGGIALSVPPRSKKTLTAALAFYRAGNSVTHGWKPQCYAYTRIYPDLESVASAALEKSTQIRDSAAAFDRRLIPPGSDPLVAELLAQASQAYYANSSLLSDAKGSLHWSVCEGQYAWRNTLDLAADHLPYELTAHPWVVANVIDGFIDRYSYRDKLRFAGETNATREGGISFTHDQGNYTAYSPAGSSAYEVAGRDGVYSFMTMEQLLNGAYCASAYALKGNDPAWAARRLPVAREMIASMENREHWDPAQRDGILRGQSDRAGSGCEITTYDALDPALKNSCGNLYIVVKTWCAALMLERWFLEQGDTRYAKRAAELAGRAAKSLTDAFDSEKKAFPSNLLQKDGVLISAALDPLAVPLDCGLDKEMKKYPLLLERLKSHAATCLLPGNCADAGNGGLRLSASSANTWPSKVALVLASVGWLQNRPAGDVAPDACSRLADWMRGSAGKVTVSDQIDSTTGKVIGGSYYPRLVTVIALLRPPAQVTPPNAQKPTPVGTPAKGVSRP